MAVAARTGVGYGSQVIQGAGCRVFWVGTFE